MSTEPSKYAENQFYVATVNRFPLMDEVLADAFPKITLAAAANGFIAQGLPGVQAAKLAWDDGWLALANEEALQYSCTAAVVDWLAGLTRKPSLDANSIIESWESTIRAAVPFQGSVYRVLLPYGRETLTDGTTNARIDAGKAFGQRLAGQSGHASLVALAGVVQTFYGQADSLRQEQLSCMQRVALLREAQELLRVTAAEELYAMVAYGMVVWKETPLMVDTLFDVNLLRSAPQVAPGPPVDVAWDGPARRLSTSALPAGATRLDAWRLGPGGTPEKLATGEFGSSEVVIPASVTWDAGDVYQLWLVARNAKGASDPGPAVSWTAP